MKIILTAVGSTGDVEPFIPISIGLKQKGHEVLVCSNDVYKEKFISKGIEFKKVGPAVDMEEMKGVREKLEKLSPLKQLDYLVKTVFLKEGDKFYEDCKKYSKGFDLGICHSLDFLGQHALIENQIPWISVVLCPGIVPAKYNSPMHLPNLGRLFNPLLWKIFDRMKRPSEKKVEAYLFQLNKKERRISITGNFSPYLNLVASCHAFNSLGADVNKTFYQTGNFGASAMASNYKAPDKLALFLSKKKPELVFTFGSMGGDDGSVISEIFYDTIEELGVNAVIVKGWGNIESNRKSDNIFHTDYVPYDYLFQHTKIVIHHGGAGTTYMASRAGKPSIIIPHLADQQYWGNELKRIGIGGRPIHKKKLTSVKLIKEIRKMLNSKIVFDNAEKIREKILEEDGVSQAIEVIEKHTQQWLQ
ncbi:MAG: glycosyltransferase family 1 protein [Bacteroidetes bacterium]|nr:glycosyltransferase family 1 protein [Bacteroidota bacterium]